MGMSCFHFSLLRPDEDTNNAFGDTVVDLCGILASGTSSETVPVATLNSVRRMTDKATSEMKPADVQVSPTHLEVALCSSQPRRRYSGSSLSTAPHGFKFSVALPDTLRSTRAATKSDDAFALHNDSIDNSISCAETPFLLRTWISKATSTKEPELVSKNRDATGSPNAVWAP